MLKHSLHKLYLALPALPDLNAVVSVATCQAFCGFRKTDTRTTNKRLKKFKPVCLVLTVNCIVLIPFRSSYDDASNEADLSDTVTDVPI